MFHTTVALRRSQLPGAANAEVAGQDALILELVVACWLEEASVAGSSGSDAARAALIDRGVQHFAREGQVPDRSPRGARTDLPDLEVRVVGAAGQEGRRIR